MILRMVNALFNLRVLSLGRMPFSKLSIEFDDESSLTVTRSTQTKRSRSRSDKAEIHLNYRTADGSSRPFSPDEETSEEELLFPIDAIEEIIPNLDQIGPSEWRAFDTGDILDLDDVIAEYGDRLPLGFREARTSHPDWLQEIREAIPVRFIGTERLTHSFNNDARHFPGRSRRQSPRSAPDRTVRLYSEKLGQMVRQTLTEYATLSQSLDRTFPSRLVEEPIPPAMSPEALGKKLREVEEKRSNIIDAGLLAQQHEGISVPIISEVDDSRRGVLAVYAQDALTKLSVFDDLYQRVNVFKRIANARFLYKNVSVNANGLNVEALEDGSNLNLEMLSSGEQHELVMLYDLLFGVSKNSLIMIDEPELSLHVAWQEEVLNDLQDMANLSDFHALLATHSPQIINDRWDLTVQLTGPDVK